MSIRILRSFAVLLGSAGICVAATVGGNESPAPGELGGPTTALSPVEMGTWLAGEAQFDREFHIADGVGTPDFNADSCRACHQDPVLGGSGGLELNVSRFGFDNGGFGPFQNLPGGQGLSKLRPPMTLGRENYPVQADVFEQRQTPSLFGLGLIEGISDANILANEDPSDSDGDGIFGVARVLIIDGSPEVGKFGWKSQVPTLEDFVRDAMAGENGITTPSVGRGFALATDADSVPDPELSEPEVDEMAFYLENLGPPLRVGSVAPEVAQGELLFTALMCSRCHIPNINGVVDPVFAYTNLLLHDVMPTDYRGMEEPGAGNGMFRTPPLWGIRFSAPYMHDGRARGLREAIMAHESEAQASSDAFALLSASQQSSLIAFLRDL
jgi:CxxC motif-containing protein (DUF1111 family)